MTRFIRYALTAASLIVMTGCASRKDLSPMPSISKQAQADLDRPVDCARAQQDIQTLEAERASVAKQILAGVRSVLPIAAVAGILMGDYRERVEVATGSYNDAIAAKIDQINNTCGI